jgi:hypothetical protein
MTKSREISCTRRRHIRVAVALLTCMLMVSCGKSGDRVKGVRLPVYPAKGKLMMGDEPVPNATLTFHPVKKFPREVAQIRPSAHTNKDGTYEVSTYGSNDGAPAGDYSVTVSWRGAEPNLRNEEEDELAPVQFRNATTTGFKTTLKEGENTIQVFNMGKIEVSKNE